MGINKSDLLHFVIKPSLINVRLEGKSAEFLILGTAELETNCGTYLVQRPKPYAFGIYQQQENSFEDIIKLLNNPKHIKLRKRFDKAFNLDGNIIPDLKCVISDLRYATVICRLFYCRFNEPLPAASNYVGLANYYKIYYNTPFGATKIKKAIKVFKEIVDEFN